MSSFIDTEKALEDVRQHAAAFKNWVAASVAPVLAGGHSEKLSAWQTEIDEVLALVTRPERLRIALVGSTGAGKSTFLNAVLGQEILPVGVMRPCTAFVTSVSRARDGRYRIEVRFFTRDEWYRDLETLWELMHEGEGDDEEDSRRLIDAVRKRVEAVYGKTIDTADDVFFLLANPIEEQAPEAARLFQTNGRISHAYVDPKAMQDHLKSLVREDSKLWPLVKEVRIEGPYDCLEGGLEIVDLPGLNDPNEARVEVTREYLRTSPFVWMVFPMHRGITRDVQEILREERVLRTLVLSGSYETLSLVGTKADDIDFNMTSQLGLPDDCDSTDLVRAYGEQTATEARRQLEEIVLDLPAEEQDAEVRGRMIDLARHVRVHTVSASAFNKLEGVGRLRKDYGISKTEDTGIPNVRRHLAQIGRSGGMAANADLAARRIDALKQEMRFFFQVQGRTANHRLDETLRQLEQQREAFSGRILLALHGAREQLVAHREAFLGRVVGFVQNARQDVHRVVAGWSSIHWQTLRAIVRYDGVFKSPSSGRLFDLNEAIAEPLLGKLPVAWEKYFTDDLGRVFDSFGLRVEESVKSFSDQVRLVLKLTCGGGNSEFVDAQLRTFSTKLNLLSENARRDILAVVRGRRADLAACIPEVAKNVMLPAYEQARNHKGAGMKKRMLHELESVAVDSAPRIFETIHRDLLEGLSGLQARQLGILESLSKEAERQAEIIAHNATLDADQATMDPTFSSLLKSIPPSPASGPGGRA